MNSQAKYEATTLIERNIDLAFEFTQAIVADPDSMADVPTGATLVLIPSDEPEIAEANLQGAIAAFRTDRNVYLRHVGPAKT